MAHGIIGRQRGLLALGEFLDGVPASGSALVFEGVAGIGKTALWHEGIRLARERGFRVLTARSTESELQAAFTTIGDLLEPMIRDLLPQLVPVQRGALEVALLMREPEGPPPEARLIAAALLSVMRASTQQQPLVLALDDLQWVDTTSATVLRFALRRLGGASVGVLATVRGRPASLPMELDRAFVGIRRFPVEQLSVAELHRLLRSRLALTLPRPLLLRAHEIAGGNPFFALELGRALTERGTRLEGGDLALPESLRSVVADRLASLPARVRETLVAVAALATPTVTLLEPFASGVVDDLELAHVRGLVDLEDDRIRFTHPLLAPACYGSLPLHTRRRLHRRLAELDVGPGERARHLAIAATGPDEAIAAALATAAGGARARGAAQSAAELAERAVVLTPTDPRATLDRRRIVAAEHCLYAGDARRARVLLEEAVNSSEPGPIRAEALSCLAGAGPATEGFRWAESLYGRALLEPGLEMGQRTHILCELAWMAAAGGDGARGTRLADEGLALAEQLGEPEALAVGLATVARVTFWRTGRIRRDLLDRAIELEEAAGGGGSSRVLLGRILTRADQHEEARALFTVLIDEAAERGDPWLVGRLFFRAELEVAAGVWETAARVCDEGVELAREIGWMMFVPLCLSVRAEIDAYRGEAERARAAIPDLLQTAERAGLMDEVHQLLRAIGVLELSCGNAAACWRQVSPRFAGIDQIDDEYLAQLAGAVAIEALVAIGDLPEAERLLRLLDDCAAESDSGLRPLANRCRGLVHAAHGDLDRAMASLELAALVPDRPREPNPFELARTLLALGTVQRQARRKRGARETLERAAEIFELLGARLWLANTRAELRRIGGRIASTDQLSETERRIVELVVAGRRNRDVAAELSLSPNTVAWNLSKVYRKLGVSSRTELAARIAGISQG
jgi:DNA-binding CsgD family transcriptional regulator